MQFDTQRALDLVERTGTLACWDIEATGLRGDYNSILVISVKPFGKKPKTFRVNVPGHDRLVVQQAAAYLKTFDVWVTYFGKGFDVKMLDTRLLRWGLHPVEKRPHADLYFVLKANLLTARRSQGHLLSFLGTPEEKMSVSPTVWSEVVADPGTQLPILVKRCESDTMGLEALYRRTRHVIADVRR